MFAINCVIYGLEIIKIYLVMRYLLGVKTREKSLIRTAGIVLFLIMFSAYITVTNDNPFLWYIIFVVFESLVLFNVHIIRIVINSILVSMSIGILDEMSQIIIEIIFLNSEYDIWLKEIFTSTMTIVFLIVVLKLIWKRIGENIIKISYKWYLYLILLFLMCEFVVFTFQNRIEINENDVIIYITLLISIVIMFLNIGLVVFLAASNDGYRQRDEINRKFLELQKNHYLYLKEMNMDIRKFKHDMKGHMTSLLHLCEEKDYNRISEYIRIISKDIHMNEKRIIVNNGIVDAILSKFMHDVEKDGIKLNITGQLFEECGVEAYDLCVIFANLLDNAVESAKYSENKEIVLKIDNKQEEIMITMVNGFSGKRNKSGGKYYTTKGDKDNHGFGIENIKRSLKKYNGHIDMLEKDNLFYTSVYIKK